MPTPALSRAAARGRRALSLAALALATVPLACGRRPPARSAPPLLVLGLDGGERRVVEVLWKRGALPNLARLAQRGSFLPLRTAYGISPVIWTTIATGLRPTEHGITGFSVATERGDVPVSSSLRRRPALWEMAGRVRRRCAVLGWWATWPAGPVNGVMISDRVESGLDRRFWPASLAPEIERWLAAARAGGPAFGGNEASQLRDRVTTSAARDLASRSFDLLLAYYRSADLDSHNYWHCFAPGDFPAGPPNGVLPCAGRDPVADSYRAFDQALGEILAASPSDTSVLVLSDHGFRAEQHESLQLLLDLDAVLRQLGWEVARADGGVDLEHSRAWVYDSPTYRQTKLVRFGAGLDRAATTRALAHELRRATFEAGGEAFSVRPPRAERREAGADAVVEVIAAHAGPKLAIDGKTFSPAVLHFGRISGGHDPHTAGLLLAAGPLFRHGARARVTIHDVAATVLYALGLPTADDFAGKPALALFDRAWVAAHPVRRIASWGRLNAEPAETTGEDRRLLEELGALGYLN